MTFSITYVLMGINILLFFVGQSRPELIYRMTLINSRVLKNKEYDRLFLAGFAHAGLMHLGFNMLTLYFFAPFVETAIGPTFFLLLYLAAIIGGNLYCVFMRKDEGEYAALGASGGVLGVIYAAILIEPNLGLSLLIFPVPVSGWIFGILFSLISIVLTQLKRSEEARISHEGHLGGALTGALAMYLILGEAGFAGERLYFFIGGVLPIAAMLIVKLLAPSLLYRHRR